MVLPINILTLILSQMVLEKNQEQMAEDLAQLVHVNSQHLMRIFKKETGQSILEYITGRRIEIAGNMLKETDSTINCKVDIQEIWISEIANTTSMAVAGRGLILIFLESRLHGAM